MANSTMEYSRTGSIEKPLTDIDRRKILMEWNSNEKSFPQATLINLFEQQVIQSSDAIAVVCGSHSLAYKQLNDRANDLAQYLLSQVTLRPNDLVGILLENSVDMVVSLLAVLKTGAAYIPIDATYPPNRIMYMLKHAGAKAILSHKKFEEITRKNELIHIFLDENSNCLNLDKKNITSSCSVQDRIYVLYTSGSTGNPKGAGLSHLNISNLIDWYKKTYHFSTQDRNYIISSFGFDLTHKNILGTLLAGGEVHLKQSPHYDPLEIAKYIYSKNITLINCTPSAFYPILESISDINELASLRYIFLGGEPINTARLMPLLPIYNKTMLVNTYGPTECSDISCVYTASYTEIKNGEIIPIGMPIQNTKILVLDKSLQLLPPNYVGDLYLAGISIGEGYIHDPTLTEKSFLENPYKELGKQWQSKLYKTGDIGLWRSDGNIVCLGRSDDQIKLRGQRIELQEIDAILLSLGIKQSVSILKGEADNQKIVSYIISNKQENESALILELHAILPSFMIPSSIIQLDAFPLNQNGKIDKISLKQREDKVVILNKLSSIPRNYAEQLLLEVWSDILKRNPEEIGIYDNFMELGGYSILMARLALRINQFYQHRFPLRLFLENTCIATQAQAIDMFINKEKKLTNAMTIMSQNLLYFPLSKTQNRIWFVCQLFPHSPLYNLPLAYRFSGLFDESKFINSLQILIKRHQALRIYFITQGEKTLQTEYPLNIINKVYDFIDLSNLDKQQAEETLKYSIQRFANAPFNFNTGPLWLVKLFKLSSKNYVVFFNFHHIIFDGWSWGIFKKELATFYEDSSNRLTSSLPTINFSDYVVWQDQYYEQNASMHTEYWTSQLSKLCQMNLPYDNGCKKNIPFQGKRLQRKLPKNLHAQVLDFSKNNGFSAFQVYYSIFNVLCYLMKCGEDQAICIPIANRAVAEVENMIGFLVNTVIIRTQIQENISFKELCEKNKITIFEAIDHQDMSFEHLVELLNPIRDLTRNPISQILFVFQNVSDRQFNLSNLGVEQYDIETNFSRFELEWQMWCESDHIYLDIFYNHGLFSGNLLYNFVENYISLLGQVFINPSKSLKDFTLPLKIHNHQNFADNKQIQSLDIYQSVIEKAKQYPDAIAVEYGHHSYTYKNYLRKIDLISSYLSKNNVKPGALVAINNPTTIDTPAIYIAILKLGAAFLSIDEKWPTYRKQYVLNHSQAKFYISTCIDKKIEFKGNVLLYPFEEFSTVETPVVDIISYPLDTRAYVIYTSGSTGLPKGVEISSYALSSTFQSLHKVLGLNEADHFVVLTPISFDIGIFEMLFPLTIGAKLTLLHDNVRKNLSKVIQFLHQHQPTVLQTTPTLWRTLLDLGWSGHKNLNVLCGGEALDIFLAEKLHKNAKQVWNLYGPTETCIWSSAKKIDFPTEGISIGTPIHHEEFYILDKNNNVIVDNNVGELCIAGNGLAIGYLNDVELTQLKFINCKLPNQKIVRLYKTGDLSYRDSRGEYIYKGRLDDQVKINGYRVELGEIEAQLLQFPGITQAVVNYHESTLTAFVVPSKLNDNAAVANTNSMTWRKVFDEMYRRLTRQESDNNFPGWISRFTGQPFSQREMEAWLNDIAEKIIQLNPQKILEIGCGVGQLALRIAPQCELYVATDYSSSATETFSTLLEMLKKNSNIYSKIQIRNCSAHELPQEFGKFDLIVINSVIQYFPDLEYLWKLFNIIPEFLESRGHIFLGDIRDLNLLPLYRETLLNCGRHVGVEREMLFSKQFFDELPQSLPWIDRVNILPKTQIVKNELSLFRYDVLLKLKKISRIQQYAIKDNLTKFCFLPRPAINLHKLKELLRERLPVYMVPTDIRIVEHLPTTIGNKIDKARLKQVLVSQHPVLNSHKENMKIKLANFWKEILSIKNIADNSNFFDLGGHSFLVLQLLGKLKQAFDIEIPLYEFYSRPTFSFLLEKLETLKDKKIYSKNSKNMIESIPLSLSIRKDLPTVVCLHPIDGEIGWYQNIAKLGENHLNFLGLRQNKDISNVDMPTLIKKYIKQIEPHLCNKVILLGWSFGAIIACEIAANYCNSMDLYLLDPPDFNALRNNKKIGEAIVEMSKILNNKKIERNQALKLQLNQAAKFIPSFANWLNLPQIDRSYAIQLLNNLRRMCMYLPSQKIKHGEIFIATDNKSKEEVEAVKHSWSSVFTTCNFYECPVDHYNIMTYPVLQSVVNKILEVVV